jgi:hypothetical protein
MMMMIILKDSPLFSTVPTDFIAEMRNVETWIACSFLAHLLSWLGYGMNVRGSIPGRNWEFFCSPPRPERLWGQPSLLSNGYQGLFPRVKGPEREADHSHPSSAEVKNAWSCTFASPYFMAWCLVMLMNTVAHRMKFYIYWGFESRQGRRVLTGSGSHPTFPPWVPGALLWE